MKRGLQQVVTAYALVIMFAVGGSARAGVYNITKVVTWDVDKLVGGVHTPNPGPMKLSLFGHNFNDDNHPKINSHLDNIQESLDLVAGNPYTSAIVTNMAFQQPVKTDHVYWSAPRYFPQDVAGTFGYPSPSPYLISNTHITTDLGINFSWPAPAPNPATGRFELVTTINATGSAFKTSSAHAGETAYGEVASGGSVTVRGVYLAGTVNGSPANPPPIGIRTTASVRADTNSFGPNFLKNRGWYSDPISLAISDSVTGDLIAQQDLWSQEWLTYDGGEGSWNDTGLSLSAGADGFASVTFTKLGSWLQNGIDGSAKIENGVFTTSGDLASLSWYITNVGGDTFASLSPSQLSNQMSLNVVPDGLGMPQHDLFADLTFPEEGSTNAYTTDVPEPSALILLSGTMLLSLCGRARKEKEMEKGE